MKETSIYVHIPFCLSKCYYCAFCSFVGSNEQKESYFRALLNEIKLKAKKFKNCCVKTIYIGGGTPSVVSSEFIKQILNQIYKSFNVLKNAEITIELNPNSVDKEKLKDYFEAGVNRLSVGVQSFNKKALVYVGRIKKNEARTYRKKVFYVLKMAREIGFKNISCDFILGLPHQPYFSVKKTIKKLSKFSTHFSCYMLELEKETKLKEILKKPLRENIFIFQYLKSSKFLKKLGFNRYEISNFAKKGFESKHNLNYWYRGNYLGFGLGAHSFFENKRFSNSENFKDYVFKFLNLENFDFNKINYEKLTILQIVEETIMLSLRTEKGLDLAEFKQKFFDLENKVKKLIDKYLKHGLVEIKKNSLKLTDKGILVSNEIIVNLINLI